MNCTKCGTEVGVGAFFCPTCGNNLIQSQPLTPNITTQEILPTNTFTKFTYSKSHAIVNFVSAIFMLILFIVSLISCLLAEIIAPIRISQGYYFAFNGTLKWIFTFCTITTLLCATMSTIRCIVFYKMCLCVYNNKIIGICGKNLFFATETFELEYPNIINMKLTGNFIFVETNIKIYKCAIQDAKQAYDMIMNLRNNKNHFIAS